MTSHARRLRLAVQIGTAVALMFASALVFAQGGRFRGFDILRPGVEIPKNTPYDGRFTFMRIRYENPPGGYWYRGLPAWAHGFPTAEHNLLRILDALTTLSPHVNEINTATLDDPEIFKYPVLYIIEPGWWDMKDAEAVALRAYILKGGFVIVDDFKLPGGNGGGGWAHFQANMRRVMPEGRFVDLDASHPIFHQFFDIPSLDIVPQAYNAGLPIFRGLFEDNDPSKPLQMIVNYNTDISQFWEWSERGRRSISDTNEAYKLGVNYVLYGMLH